MPRRRRANFAIRALKGAPWPRQVIPVNADNLLSPTNLTTAPHAGVRKTIRTIVVVVGILIVAMWALVGFSLVTARQTALSDAGLEGRNLMVAFREESPSILRGVEAK